MTRTEILNAFKVAAADVLAIDPDQIVEGASLMTDFEADSLDVVEVVMMVEEQLDMRIPDDLWESVKNIGEAIDAIVVLQKA